MDRCQIAYRYLLILAAHFDQTRHQFHSQTGQPWGSGPKPKRRDGQTPARKRRSWRRRQSADTWFMRRGVGGGACRSPHDGHS